MSSQLIRSLLSSGLLQVANAGLGLIIAVVLARKLGADGYGLYSAAFVMGSVCATVAQFGFPNIVMRETAVATVDKDWARMRAVWRWASRRAAAVASTVLVVGAGTLFLLGYRLGTDEGVTYGLAVGLVPLLTFGALRAGALRGLQHPVLAQTPEMMVKPTVMLMLALSLGVVLPATAGAAMAMQLVAVAAASGLGAVFLYLKYKHAAATRRVTGAHTSEMPSATSITSFAIVAASTQVNQYFDILTLRFFCSDAEVGVYRAAWQLSLVVGFGSAVSAAILPSLFARHHANQDATAMSRVLSVARVLGLILALPAASFCLLAPEYTLALLYGQAFAAGANILIIFTLLRLMTAAVGPLGAYLNMVGHERASGRAHLFAASINLGLNIALVPRFGGIGAAVATLASYGALSLILVLMKRRLAS